MPEIDFDDLIRTRQLQRESAIGQDQIERLLKRSRQDLDSAKRIKPTDEAAAMDLAYKAMFHAANALLARHKLRPGPVRQHQGVIEATTRILAPEATTHLLQFDRLRRRRNLFEYQGVFEMGSEELDEALANARELVAIIKRRLSKKSLP